MIFPVKACSYLSVNEVLPRAGNTEHRRVEFFSRHPFDTVLPRGAFISNGLGRGLLPSM